MRKETDLARVKMIAHVLLDMPIAETSFSPAIVSHPFTSTGVTAAQNEDGNITVVDLLNNKEDYAKWKEMVGKQIDSAENACQVFFLLNKPYTLIDLLKQELPENESRQHTETVSLESKSKDMESVLALLPQEKEFITEDGLSGVLTLQLDTVQVEVAGYGSSTREVSATRSYPNLASQDTANIPKTIEDNGRTLTLQNISWQTDNTANTDGYAMGDRFTAVATYTGSATSSYVTGYTVTADYSGTVSRIALNKTRYVAIFEGTAIEPLAPLPDSGSSPVQFNWAYILVPLGVVFAAGGVIGGCLLYKRKHESEEETE